MVRNTLEDVNNLLVAQLEKLSDDSLTDEQLEMEISRSRAMGQVTGDILRTQSLALRAVETLSEVTTKEVTPPQMLLSGGGK